MAGQKQKLKKNLNKDLCRICKVEYRSKEDYDRDSLWVRCARPGCSYWAHCKCSNIFYSSDDRDMLEAWSQLHFFCQEHMPLQDEDILPVSPTPVCRNRQDIVEVCWCWLEVVGLNTLYFVFVFVFVEHQKIARTKKK